MINSIKQRVAAWNSRRETIRELSMLSDRELADLGIGRGDIPFVADGSLLAADEAHVADTLVGPAWARHAPASLAA